MRYPPDQKVKARAALVRAGTRSMNEAGFNGIGVDGLAAAAGVTSGAFYSNFANKAEVLEAIVCTAGESFLADTETSAKTEWRSQLKKFIAEYLSDDHVTNPGDGCVIPALSADVARASARTRKACEDRMSVLVDRMADTLDGTRADRKRRAWIIVSVLVGAISVARAMSDTAMQTEVIAAARTATDRLVLEPANRGPTA
jgi:AcrR family transcriptional regulator